MEDELLRCLPEHKRRRLQAKARSESDGELSVRWESVFRSAQRSLEKMHRKQRKQLLKRENQHAEAYEKMGLDPITEFADESG